MSEERALMLSEVRYSERLCQRTARLYRHLDAANAALTILAGGATLSALSDGLPDWLSVAGGLGLAVVGAIHFAMRPGDKAAVNESDMRKYAALRARATKLDDAALRAAIEEARESDVEEVESLREVAYNDVVREVGRDDQIIPLRLHQKLLAAIA